MRNKAKDAVQHVEAQLRLSASFSRPRTRTTMSARSEKAEEAPSEGARFSEVKKRSANPPVQRWRFRSNPVQPDLSHEGDDAIDE